MVDDKHVSLIVLGAVLVVALTGGFLLWSDDGVTGAPGVQVVQHVASRDVAGIHDKIFVEKSRIQPLRPEVTAGLREVSPISRSSATKEVSSAVVDCDVRRVALAAATTALNAAKVVKRDTAAAALAANKVASAGLVAATRAFSAAVKSTDSQFSPAAVAAKAAISVASARASSVSAANRAATVAASAAVHNANVRFVSASAAASSCK